MLAIELCLALLLGMLGPLVSAPALRARPGGWYPWSGVLLATWMAAVGAVLVQRFPDWAVLYAFEAKDLPGWAVAVGTVALSVGAAWLGSTWVIGPIRQGRSGLAVARTVMALAAAALLLFLLRGRITHMATTFEYRHGLVRPIQHVFGLRGLVTLVAIAIGIPGLGVLLLLLMESLGRVYGPRERRVH
jgi:hypothetical protein